MAIFVFPGLLISTRLVDIYVIGLIMHWQNPPPNFAVDILYSGYVASRKMSFFLFFSSFFYLHNIYLRSDNSNLIANENCLVGICIRIFPFKTKCMPPPPPLSPQRSSTIFSPFFKLSFVTMQCRLALIIHYVTLHRRRFRVLIFVLFLFLLSQKCLDFQFLLQYVSLCVAFFFNDHCAICFRLSSICGGNTASPFTFYVLYSVYSPSHKLYLSQLDVCCGRSDFEHVSSHRNLFVDVPDAAKVAREQLVLPRLSSASFWS